MHIWLAGRTIYSADANGESIDIQIPEIPQNDYSAALIKMFLSLIVVIILLTLTFWFLRRLIQTRLRRGMGTNSIQILEKKMISPKSMLYLVEVEGQKVLLAESQLEIRRLQTWEHPKESEIERT